MMLIKKNTDIVIIKLLSNQIVGMKSLRHKIYFTCGSWFIFYISTQYPRNLVPLSRKLQTKWSMEAVRILTQLSTTT